MSREIDNTGKIIVCDKVIETSQRTTEADMSSDLSTLNGTFGFSVGQKQFSKDFSMSLSGSPNVSDSVPASLRVDIYRNGTRLDISNPIVKGSSLLWESMDGKFMKFGEYTETFMQEIGVGDLEKNREKFKVTWTTKDADSVPLTAAIDVSIGEKVQYALSRYIDQSKVAEDSVVWFDTMEGALGVSHPYNCYLWTRSSSYYDFTNKCYVDWKYFKGDLYYEGQSVDDTVDDMAGKLNKYIEFTSSTDRFTVDKRSNGSDTIRMGVNINGYSNVTFRWSADIQLLPDGQENNQEIAFVVSHDNDYQSITVEVEVSYVEGEETKVVAHQFNLFPIDITKPEMYLGVLDSIPDGDYISSLQKKVMTGDWFLLSSTNELYTWNGSAWVCINSDSVTGTTFKDLEKVSVALVDMIKIGTNDKTTATILGVFDMLVAKTAFIEKLLTQQLVLKEKGFMKSDGYTEGSSSKGFILKSDGTFECVNGTFKGSIEATKGNFTGQLDCISIKTTLGGETSYTVGDFTNAEPLLSNLNSIQTNLGVNILDSTFKASGNVSGKNITSITVSPIYVGYKNVVVSIIIPGGSRNYGRAYGTVCWLNIAINHSSGAINLCIRKIKVKNPSGYTSSVPAVDPSKYPSPESTIDSFLALPDFPTASTVDESNFSDVGGARNEDCVVSGLKVYDNTQERLFFYGIPSSAPSESNRVYRNGNYLMIT